MASNNYVLSSPEENIHRELSKGQKMEVTTAICATQYMKDTDAAVCLMTPLSLLLNMNISV